MARKIVYPKPADAAAAINAPVDVSTFEKFTVFAAATSKVFLSGDGGATFDATGITVPAAGYVTITDQATHAKCNATARYVGLYAHDGE